MRRQSAERVYVSGECGQLARLLIREFRQEGHDVINDDCPAPRTWRNREIDFTNRRHLAAVKALEPTLVVHAGAICGTDNCASDPAIAANVNMIGTMQVASMLPDARFVYFSTTAIYDPHAPRPLTEISHVAPHTVYGQTKWGGELLLQTMVAPARLIILRPCFIYGGANDNSSVLAQLIRRGLLHDARPLVVDLNPAAQKDFLYADDFARIAYGVIMHNSSGVFNIARGQPRPYEDVITLLEQHDIRPCVKFRPDRDYLGDHIVQSIHVPQWAADELKTLEQGIDLAIEDIRSNT